MGGNERGKERKESQKGKEAKATQECAWPNRQVYLISWGKGSEGPGLERLAWEGVHGVGISGRCHRH